MKIKQLILAITSLPLFSLAEDAEKKPSLTADFLDGEVWKKSLTELKESFDQEEGNGDQDHLPEEILKQLAEQGINLSTSGGERFSWLSSKKNGLRAPEDNFTLLDKNIGEVVLRGENDEIKSISISLYNRGDDDELSVANYRTLMEEWKTLLDEKLKVRPRSRDGSGVVATTGWMWTSNNTAFLLEGSVSKSPKRAEFIRLRIAATKGYAEREKTASRMEIKRNVVKKENGDVVITGIPMVDQGQKGYCVVASIERVARYYGLKVDQHEMAQLADTTSGGGTSPDDMEKAFKKITGKIHTRTNRVIDYDYDQLVKDVKAYNREAKKQEAKIYDINFDTHYVNALGFWTEADKDVFKGIKSKQTRFKLFNNKIEEFIDRGVPICWTLYLGMFPEKGLPQSWGGHMRLIIGYNKKTGEIIYSDSWGDGHEMKKMSSAEAWCMTTGLYAMIPLN